MEKKAIKTFKEYAQLWKDFAAQVNPPLSNKEMVLVMHHQNFLTLLLLEKKIKYGVKISKTIDNFVEAMGVKKPMFNKKKGR